MAVSAADWRSRYRVIETIREDAATRVYRATRIDDGRAVFLKMPGASERARGLTRLENEYRVAAALDAAAAVSPLAFEHDGGDAVLVLPDNGEEPLERVIGAPLDLDDFLRLAIGMASALAEVHARGFVHKNLSPRSVVVQRATAQVRLTNFELASRVPCEQPDEAGLIEGPLPYLSPEQTGRTWHAIDFRADLYSLGITLYQLRAGKLPFAASDALGWIHSHLARTPPPLDEAAPGTPPVLAAIVARLLAKLPEERYQSAVGLRLDLERCRERLDADGAIADFPLGQGDASDRFLAPRRLYDRDPPFARLRGALESVVARRRPALMLVVGNAGVGKSALVRRMHEPVARERGLLLTGKYDQAKRDIPYSILTQAFGAFVQRLAAEPEAVRADWRHDIAHTLGANAQLVVDVVPALAALIGAPPPPPPVPLDQAERRFRYVLRQFLGVLARRENPLVLFLDDLHWADRASLRLVEDALVDPELGSLMIIGAYRDNEVDEDHPLRGFITRMEAAGAAMGQIHLMPLGRAELEELVVDSVRRPRREAAPLAALLYEKTAGNPLFATQLLQSLHDEGLLTFDAATASWRWDLDAIAARALSDDVVELTVRTLKRLPAPTLAALEVAACLGNAFSLETLALVRKQTRAEVERDLWEAVRAGMILRSGGGLRFLHDRVQQATLTLLEPGERRRLHLAIGRALQAHAPPEHIFLVVNQLNQASALLADEAERAELAGLNLRAAKRARAGAAHAAAIDYLEAGLPLLGADAWARRYELAYELHLERARCEYLHKSFAAAEAEVATLLAHCRSVAERAGPTCIAIQIRFSEGRVKEALELALDYLGRCGLAIALDPGRAEAEAEIARVLGLVGARSIESLVDLPPMTDELSLAVVMVLVTAIPSATVLASYLWPLLVCHLVRVTLEHGATEQAASCMVFFAVVLGAVFERYQEGARFGRLGLALLERQARAARAPVYLVFGFVCYFGGSFDDAIAYTERAFSAGIEDGDLTYAGGGCINAHHAMIARGRRLAEVQREAERGLGFVERHGLDTYRSDILVTQQFLHQLTGRGPVAQRARVALPPYFKWRSLVRRVQACVVLGDYGAARAAAEEARPLIRAVPDLLLRSEMMFYSGLAEARLGARQGVIEPLRALTALAESNPTNFGDRAEMLAAELARLDGRTLDAMRGYERAIVAARQRGLVHHQALASELAGELYAAEGFAASATLYFKAARAAYQEWGAVAKVRQLDERHRDLAPAATASPVTLAAAELDFLSVIKASQAISRQTELDELLDTLMRVMLEQGGAREGALVLVQADERTVAAKARVAEDGVRVELLRGHHPPGDLEAQAQLCVPIERQAATIGYLYLSNELVPGAFTPARLSALEVLAAQAAISLENVALLERELAVRKAAEAARAQAAFLAEAGALLAESLDYERVLVLVSQLVVQSLADWCVFDLADGEHIRARALTHADPHKRALAQLLAERYPPRRDSRHPTAQVLRSGQPLWFSDLSDELIRSYATDDEHARLLRELGTRSVVVMPLRARERVLGALTLGSATPGRYQRVDLQLLEELARRAAMTVDNALLYRDAREAIRLRDEFLRIASHELATPMTSLLLSLEGLLALCDQGRLEPEPTAKQLSRTLRQARRLRRLGSDLLDVTRLETGQLGLDRGPVDLVELVREVIDRFEVELGRAGCTLRFEAPATLRGLWDSSRLDQVVSNLISNAIKFGPGHPIEVRVTASGARAELRVTDHGIGVDAAHAGSIFNRFVRGVSSSHYGGLGLGLYIARQIVELHGGTILVRSQLGDGATFIIDLPTGDL